MKIQYPALLFAAALAIIALFPHTTSAATKATNECCVEQQNCCESGQSCCN